MHKKKRRKKKLQADTEKQETDEIGETKVNLSDTEEQMKQLKLSEKVKKNGAKSKKLERGSDTEISPLKACSDDEHSDEIEMEDSVLAKKKRYRKRRHLDDYQSDEPMSYDEQSTLLHDDKTQDNDELNWSGQESDFIVAKSSLSEGSQGDMVDTQNAEGDEVVPLMPLGHREKMAREGKTVQRRLPQWITAADIIPDDIAEQSR